MSRPTEERASLSVPSCPPRPFGLSPLFGFAPEYLLMRDGEMMLRLLKQEADEEHGRVNPHPSMHSGHKEYHQIELLVDAGLS